MVLWTDICFAVSYNQPTFSSCASWNSSAVTVTSYWSIGGSPRGVFVDRNKTAFFLGYSSGAVYVLPEGSNIPSRNVTELIRRSLSLFVSEQGDVYVGSGLSDRRVFRWSVNGSSNVTVMITGSTCYGLFLDLSNSLYCSLRDLHLVIKQVANGAGNISNVAVGTGCAGSLANSLIPPTAIFVHTNFDLYVADTGNHRIQKFTPGQMNALTVVGNGAPGTISLNAPQAVVLDGAEFLFIADSNNNRIVCSSPNGFRCIAGCLGITGSSPSKLSQPYAMSFDSYGNIFIADTGYDRIQKFFLATNYCIESSTELTAGIDTATAASITINEPTEISTTEPDAMLNRSMDVSFNQPYFDSCATWNRYGSTFANLTMVSHSTQSIFIDRNDIIHVPQCYTGAILVWPNGSSLLTRNLNGTVRDPYGFFLSLSGDMHVDNGGYNTELDKWTMKGISGETVMLVPSSCHSVFVDIADHVYCSLPSLHQVLRKPLAGAPQTVSVVAGTGCSESAANRLDSPRGIFVDVNFDLYVADSWNDRIQRFRFGQLNATTIVGRFGLYNWTLYNPTGVVLDGDGNLFIVGSDTHRIIIAGSNGTRCIIGCLNPHGSASDQLDHPSSMSFDSFGNIFVTDIHDQRIQKFLLATNSCAPPLVTSFAPPRCNDSYRMGIGCNISTAPCEVDAQPCQIDSCWNGGMIFSGICLNTSQSTFVCRCAAEWKGSYCELQMNYCGKYYLLARRGLSTD